MVGGEGVGDIDNGIMCLSLQGGSRVCWLLGYSTCAVPTCTVWLGLCGGPGQCMHVSYAYVSMYTVSVCTYPCMHPCTCMHMGSRQRKGT